MRRGFKRSIANTRRAAAGAAGGLRRSARRRDGRVLITVLLVSVALTAGAAGGYWLPRGLVGMNPAAGAGGGQGGEDEQWYTCGMHPNVLQQGPGLCPICGMKLTPLDEDDDGAKGAAPSTEREVLYWRAPMNPNYISEKPGKSPMGMDLVPVYADETTSASSHTIRIDPVTIQNMGIRTARLERGPLVKTIRTVGRVDYDEQLVTFINTKFEGWIEKLYVDKTGQHVDKGQRLFDVYSRELYDSQTAYLASLRMLLQLENATFPEAKADALRQIEADKLRLLYYDVSEQQIAALAKTKEVKKNLTIHSPAAGIVTEKMALEGMYVKPGMKLYTIGDLSRVWVYVDIYEYQLPWVRIGQEATMRLPYIPGTVFEGRVVYIYPYLDKQTRVIKVRLEFENPDLELKPEMYANITLATELERDALLIPREAYIDSGTRKLAFVYQGDGKFAPREIQVGVEAEGGMVEVLHGLDAGEAVVTSGQFLLDAESKLKEAVAKMKAATRAPAKKKPSHAGKHRPDRMGDDEAGSASHDHATSMPADAKFACPMERHPDETDPARQGAYVSLEPGKCPWCGMKLKPIEELDWAQLRLAAKGADVAYTCRDHQHVFSDGPGQCPRCGKTLMSFKVMYTCRDPAHAGIISTFFEDCPRCDQPLAPYRGIWLDASMAEANLPPNSGPSEVAAFRCPKHPLVHSTEPGSCTICAARLEPTKVASTQPSRRGIPSDAKYVCPMKECWHFAAEPGECPECGMAIKPIDQVAWAGELADKAPPVKAEAAYVCPMHPKEVRSSKPGPCTICAMQLVSADSLKQPQEAPKRIAAQINYLTEHYLELQKLLASDRTTDVPLHALGLVSASEEVTRNLENGMVASASEVREAVTKLRAAALKIKGTNLENDRVTFVDLSGAMGDLIRLIRPDVHRWPKLYIYHCPMSKGDWIQATEEKANPYYGFKMLKCGELRGVE